MSLKRLWSEEVCTKTATHYTGCDSGPTLPENDIQIFWGSIHYIFSCVAVMNVVSTLNRLCFWPPYAYTPHRVETQICINFTFMWLGVGLDLFCLFDHRSRDRREMDYAILLEHLPTKYLHIRVLCIFTLFTILFLKGQVSLWKNHDRPMPF